MDMPLAMETAQPMEAPVEATNVEAIEDTTN